MAMNVPADALDKYGDVCRCMLTYADLCRRMLMYTDVYI